VSAEDPRHYIWWLISRASGLVALALVTLAVLIGLTMSTRSVGKPALRRSLMRLHENVALAGLIAIALHGLALLGDHWLRPGIAGISVPFTLRYRPLYTGLGIIGGYLAAILALSYYFRTRMGVRLWRRLHRATVIAYALCVVHTIGAGSDGSSLWLRAAVFATAAPIAYLTLVRMFVAAPAPPAAAAAPPDPMITARRLEEAPAAALTPGGAHG
jgi:sulfoxide reductase heme-binding subunit YedZ